MDVTTSDGRVPVMQPAHVDPSGELPLTVWLRGDEDFVVDFTMDAEQVMAELGIRRSRLTQISGRELRVGRIRRGRYVAPVYRPEDVETYKSWTRATASHVKSSTVLNEAAQSLREETNRVADAMQDLSRDVAQAAEHAVRGGVAQLGRLVYEPVQSLLEELRAEAAARRHGTERLEALVAKQEVRLQALVSQLEAQAVAQLVVGRELAELASLARLARQEHQEEAKDQAQALALLSQRLTEVAALQEQALTPTESGAKPRRAAGAAAARRIRRLTQAGQAPAALSGARAPAPARAGSSPTPSLRRSSRSYRAERRRPLA